MNFHAAFFSFLLIAGCTSEVERQNLRGRSSVGQADNADSDILSISSSSDVKPATSLTVSVAKSVVHRAPALLARFKLVCNTVEVAEFRIGQVVPVNNPDLCDIKIMSLGSNFSPVDFKARKNRSMENNLYSNGVVTTEFSVGKVAAGKYELLENTRPEKELLSSPFTSITALMSSKKISSGGDVTLTLTSTVGFMGTSTPFSGIFFDLDLPRGMRVRRIDYPANLQTAAPLCLRCNLSQNIGGYFINGPSAVKIVITLVANNVVAGSKYPIRIFRNEHFQQYFKSIEGSDTGRAYPRLNTTSFELLGE